MKKLLKKIYAAITAIAVTLTAVAFDVPERILTVAAADMAAETQICTGDHLGWAEIADQDNLELKNGEQYYLTGDIDLSLPIEIESGVNVTLCLNGHTINAASNKRIFNINGGTFTLCDCSGGGKLTGGTETNGGAVYVDNNGTFNMHGGTISGNKAGNGGGVYVKDGAFTMNGGTISGNTASNSNSGYGGGVYAAKGVTFTMSGGTIGGETEADANSAKYGGGVYAGADTTFIMNGSAKISGNIATYDPAAIDGNGGGVYSEGTFAMSGDSVISDNKAKYGGGVNVTVGPFTMEDNSKISRNTSGSQGGGVYMNYKAEFKMSGGSAISDNESGDGGGVMVSVNTKFIMEGSSEISGNRANTAGGVYVHKDGSFIMNGGKISDNTISKRGGGVYVYGGGSFTMSGGEISDNTAGGEGGGVFVYGNNGSNATFTMTGGAISGNMTSSDGGGVELWGIFTMSGGRISDNTADGSGGGVDFYKEIFTISGKVEISNNRKNDAENNVYLYNGKTITIVGSLDTDSEIGVSSQGTLADCRSSVDAASFDDGVTAADISAGFKADTDGQNIVYKDDKVWLTGAHSYGDEWFGDVDFHWHECALCGAHESNIDHVWEIGNVIAAPDCTEGGTGEYVCSFCDVKKTGIIPVNPDAHEWKDWVIILDPSRTDKGTIQRVCDKNPGHIETEEIPELTDEEFWTLTDSEKPGCTKDGYEIYECDYGKVTVTLPSGHTSVTDDKVEPTCVDTGLTEGSHCGVCGEVLIERTVIAALGHDWDEGKVTTPPDCTHNGVKTFTCSRCGEKEAKDIEAAGHTEVTDEAVPATCTETGKTAGSHCGVCGTVIKAQEELPALGHSWDDGVVTDPPSEDTEGIRTYTCTVCGATRTETIPATGGSTTPVNPDNPDPENPDPDKPDPENPDPDNPGPDKPDPDNGNISKEVQPGENAPDTELKTPLDELIDAVLTPEEQALVDEGVEIKIVLTVEDGTGSVPAEDKEKVETAVSGLPDWKIGQYLDVNLLKIIGDNQEKVTETNTPIILIFTVPEALRGEGRTYSVIRVHDGEADVLSDLDSDTDTITIKTDKFSIYALVYSEKTNVTPPDSGSGSGGSFTVPDPSGSDGGDTAPTESETTDGSVSAPTEGGPTDGGNTLPESGSSSDNGTALPSGEASSTDENGTDPGGSAALTYDNTSMPSESAVANDNDGSDDNPSTGIAVSLVPFMAIAVISAASVKLKKK